MTNKTIDCDCHQRQGKPTFVCQHLSKNAKTGFHEYYPSDPDDIDEEEEWQAWCDECEKVRLSTDGWDDESMKFAKIKLVCDQCYLEIKKCNQTT